MIALAVQVNVEYVFKALNISYDFELIYALGSNLGVTDPEAVLELIDACEKAGVDIISMGVILVLYSPGPQKCSGVEKFPPTRLWGSNFPGEIKLHISGR
ncbi:MAG: hypothetical protein NHB15_11125 [Methanosarcina barkeri]|nr:hypothetical protein [Methanosarcina sp. ERenArc_MAG2]